VKRLDVRAALEAVAAGKAPIKSGAKIIDPQLVKATQKDFVAWDVFATPNDGEPISAPQELLTPLP
jgi:hypothetical protein